jgi:hypothetical protein
MSIFNCLDLSKQFVQVRGPARETPHIQIDKRHDHFQLLRFSKSEALCDISKREVIHPNPNPGIPPFVGYLPLLFRYIRSYPPYLMTSLLHTQHEGEPCRGDRRLLNMHQYLWRIWLCDTTHALRLTVMCHTVVKRTLTKYMENVCNSRGNSRCSRVTWAQIVTTRVTYPTTFSTNQRHQHAHV